MIRLGILLGLVCFSFPAAAKNWVVDYAHSQLGFIGTEGDKSFNGSFRHFTITVDFDPAAPEAGSIKTVIYTNSATAGNKERDDYLPQKVWFDVLSFPQATFISTHIHKTADGYAAEGNLTIKNISHPVMLNFTLIPEGDHTHVTGKASLNRTDFKVGEGEWANENYVKFPVVVVVDLVAKEAP